MVQIVPRCELFCNADLFVFSVYATVNDSPCLSVFDSYARIYQGVFFFRLVLLKYCHKLFLDCFVSRGELTLYFCRFYSLAVLVLLPRLAMLFFTASFCSLVRGCSATQAPLNLYVTIAYIFYLLLWYINQFINEPPIINTGIDFSSFCKSAVVERIHASFTKCERTRGCTTSTK